MNGQKSLNVLIKNSESNTFINDVLNDNKEKIE